MGGLQPSELIVKLLADCGAVMGESLTRSQMARCAPLGLKRFEAQYGRAAMGS